MMEERDPLGSEKVLVIGLDGATFDVLTPLVEQGCLPNVGALMERGCWGRLSSTIPPFTATAWSSFITGQNPGNHGVMSFRRERDRYNYDMQGSGVVDASAFAETLWDVIGAGNKRVGIVNVPLTYPARPVNGYVVTGMLTPLGADRATYPTNLAEPLGPDYVIDLDFIRQDEGLRIDGFPPKTELIAEIRHMSSVRAKTCTRLLQERPWDFFMVVFTSTDRVQHFFWDELEQMLDDEGPEDRTRPGTIQHQLGEYFRELDEGIGRMVELAGPATTVLIVSDHGFGPAPTRRFYVNVWLERLGLLHPRGPTGLLDPEYWRVTVGRNKTLKGILRRILPRKAQDSASSAIRSASKDIVDWSRTRAYFVPLYFHVCGVEINMKGARREGIVKTAAEYEALRTQIIQEARQLKDPQRGDSIVDLAARRESLYEGPYVDAFPDVILVLNPDCVAASSLAGGSLVEHHSAARPGEHRQDGILIAASPFVPPHGERTADMRLLDVPPTILYALGLPVPQSFDGRVLDEIIDPGYLATHRTQRAPSRVDTPDAAPIGPAHSADEEEQIEERLRGLGYID